MRFGAEALAFNGEVSGGNGSDASAPMEGSGIEDPQGSEAAEDMAERAGNVEQASDGSTGEVDCSGSVEMAEVVDARGVGGFCNEVINSDTNDKDSDRAFEEDEATANASDNEPECLDGELIDSGRGEDARDDVDDKDESSCTRALASGGLTGVVGVRGDDGGEDPGLPVMGVQPEEALNLSVS